MYQLSAVSRYAFTGLYEMTEAALYLRASRGGNQIYRVDSSKLIRWIRQGLSDRDLVGIKGSDLIIGFEDLISLRVIAALRAAGVSFREIYAAEEWLRKTTQHPRPFATELLWTEGSHVFVSFCQRLIAASRSGQMALEFLRDWLMPVHGLEFDSQGVAVTWEPHKGIMLSPDIQLGAPCIKGTSIPTSSIWGMVEGGDSIEYVTKSYSIERREVELAIEWKNGLRELNQPAGVA